MKKILVLLLISFNLFSQGVVINSQIDLIKYVKKMPYNVDFKSNFNVRFIYIGKNKNKLNDEIIENIKTKINKSFSNTNISFKYQPKIYYINSNINIDSLYFLQNQHFHKEVYDDNAINFYIVENTSKKYNGLSSYPVNKLKRVFIEFEYINDAVIEHELGHYFGLLHTFDNTDDNIEENPNLEGDFISDTPIDKENISDKEKNLYNPDMTNFMSYYGKRRNNFTKQQIKLMNNMATYRTFSH